LGRLRLDELVVYGDLAGGWVVEACEEADHCGLAVAGGADEDDGAPGGYFDCDVCDGVGVGAGW
jgi:hypothetical protein